MSAKRITRRTLSDRRSGVSDWARVDKMTEEEVESNATTDPDNGLWTEEQLAGARLVMPDERKKVPVNIRLDAEVLDFFKASGARYQTRINAVLRSYVRSMKASKAKK